MSENPLHLLMSPKSIAVVGANNNPSKMGSIQALNILKDGFPGKFYPIHPTEKQFWDFPPMHRRKICPKFPIWPS